MQIPLIVTNDNQYTFYKSFGRALSFSVGDIVKAEVLNALSSGTVSLRITRDNGETGIITAQSRVPLSAGSQVLLKVSGGEGDIRLQLVGTASEGSLISQPPQDNTPVKLLKMLADSAGLRLNNEDITTLKEAFGKLPPAIRDAFPEFRAIEDLMPRIEKLNSELLKKSVEGSGILFETKLRLISQEMSGSGPADGRGFIIDGSEDRSEILSQVIKDDDVLEAFRSSGKNAAQMATTLDEIVRGSRPEDNSGKAANAAEKITAQTNRAFDPSTDQKALLLKLGELMKDDDVVASLRSAGVDLREVANAADRLLKNIEFFQLSSRASSVLYMFLPVTWQDMRDGEITFRLEERSGGRACTCDINLDLNTLGKVSVSVTLFEGSYHITFYAEDVATKALIETEKGLLEQSFASAGLPLRALGVSGRKAISFGVEEKKALDIRI